LAVAENDTGDPLAPLRLAVAVCEPEMVPSVQAVVAIPLASVTAEVGLTVPPDAVVAQVTVVPALAAPASVTTT
jgi:hypothetical protein